MPISEDEFDSHQVSNNNSHQHHQSNMSKAELRRSNKPIMEKRRRARINHCLNELKALILDAMKKDPARHSKLEKADILEMTVKHLQTVQRQQLAVAVATDPTVMHKFKSGFNECAGEVSRYISSMEDIDSGVKQRLVGHLSTCVTGLQQITPFSFPGMASGSLNIGSTAGTINIPLQPNPTNVPIVVPPVPFSSGDVNNNGSGTRIQMPGGIQLIPSRLPTGELALLVPNSSNLPFFPSTSLGNPQQDFPPQPPPQADSSSSLSIESSIKSAHYQSAFTSVSRSKSPSGHHKLSPPLSPSSPSTSYTEENLHSENFHRTSTPSPHIRTQKTITAPYPTPPNQPSVDKSTFTSSSTFLPDSCHKSQQQPHVTSTSISPESKVVSSSDLKIGYKSVPIYQHVEKHRHYSVKAETSSRAQSSMDQPLTVITTDKYKIPLVHQDYHALPTSSMSPRKRPYKSSATDRLLVVANQPPSPKVMKYSTEVVSSSQTYRGTSASPENLTNKTADSTFSTDSSFGTSPSTSASSGSGTSNVSGSTDSMWRPW